MIDNIFAILFALCVIFVIYKNFACKHNWKTIKEVTKESAPMASYDTWTGRKIPGTECTSKGTITILLTCEKCGKLEDRTYYTN